MASQNGSSGLSFLVTPTVIEKQQVIRHCETTTCTWWKKRQLQAIAALLVILGVPRKGYYAAIMLSSMYVSAASYRLSIVM
jgi:hypothetical protein